MAEQLDAARRALATLDDLLKTATDHVTRVVDGRGDAGITENQTAAHGLAHLATNVAAGRQLARWADGAGPAEEAIAAAWVGRVASGLLSGVSLGGAEVASLADLGLDPARVYAAFDGAFLAASAGSAMDEQVAAGLDAGQARPGLDESLALVRAEFARFANDRVVPIAQRIHRDDALIPLDLIREMAQLGVFGLTLPEEFGGSGLGKLAMVVVTEELSRGYIGVGSLGTRSEIAGELILAHGTDDQKKHWLPALASAEMLPTAAFTEPNYGSDLANITTRATKTAKGWRIDGQKTWMTHGSRADLMTLMARTGEAPGHRGLSMFLAPKRRGDDANPFPDDGISGGEIRVLGYRGMREYDVAFDGFEVSDDALLGGVAGQGFKQLMVTFETARIQTAARGTGLAQAAFDEGWRYAHDRVQFGRPIWRFPRIRAKLARAAVTIQAARQLTYEAARRKEAGKRCDLEAGMAKLIATRAAAEVADAAVQIHGGMGYAEETPISRIYVDARVLSIFEGTNEIQAQIIARRLLD